MKKKLILKIGSSTLTAGTDRISYAKIEDLARQIVALRERYQIVLVSSGAIATARQFVDLEKEGLPVDYKQALAAIGQPKLMSIYDEVFRSFGLKVAQCLLVYRDFQNEKARENVKNTIDTLLHMGYTPIINENDTVSADEIIFGDNDKLSAIVAAITKADLLVLASDINGLYDKNPNLHKDAQLLESVENLEDITHFIEEIPSELGTGGMTTKIEAAKICRKYGVEMWILNGSINGFLQNAIVTKKGFTAFPITKD